MYFGKTREECRYLMAGVYVLPIKKALALSIKFIVQCIRLVCIQCIYIGFDW